MKSFLQKTKSLTALFAIIALLLMPGVGWGQYSGTGTFNKITSLTDLTDGYYVIVNSGDAFAMNNTHNGTFLANTAVTPASGTITNPATSIVWKIETNGSGRSIYNESIARFVSYSGSSNNVQISESGIANNQRWTFTYASNLFSVANLAINTRFLQYNPTSPRFVCYTGGQQNLLLYKLAEVVEPDPEPTNHAANFSATANSSSQITLTWTDASSGQLPAAYLVKAAIDPATLAAPADGTAETDATLVKNIAQGTQTAVFAGLNPETTYYFSIWPYTNSGASIDYKTNETIPQAIATTLEIPWIEDFEIGTKTSYAAGNVTCSQGSWNMDNALLGTSASDRKNGSQSVRMQNGGSITMNFNKSGAGTITILHARYGSDVVGSWKLQNSINDGANWTDVGGTVNTTSTSLTAQEFTINQSGNVRFKIIQLSGNRINIDDITITNYTEPSTSTFTGASSTAWELGLNWSNGTPGPGTDVLIPALKTVAVSSNDFECNDLTIAPLGALTINTGKDLIVNGDFLIQSDASGTGSFVENGTLVANSYTVERYISGAASAWHLISSPVAAQSISGDWTPTGTFPDGSGYDFYAWNEPSKTWLNQKVAANSITSFVPGKGYLVAYEATNPTKTFTGVLNEGIYYTAVTISGSGEYKNTHLVGNPYASSIDWKNVPGFDKSDLVGFGTTGVSHYVWNESALNYGVYSDANEDDEGTNGASRYIAPMQGFFVVAAVAGDFGIDNDARVHSTQAWLKSGNNNSFRLKATAPESFGSDELLLEFGHNTSTGGAEKWNSFVATAPALFTTKEEMNYSISFLSSVSENPVVPVSFAPGTEGNYTLTADYNTAEFSLVSLFDKKTSTTHDLNANPVYSFNATPGDDANRFTLHFSTLGIDNPATTSSISVYTHGETLYISGLNAKAEISVVNLTGQVVISSRSNGSGLHSVNAASLPKGVYVVSVISNGQAISRKVVL